MPTQDPSADAETLKRRRQLLESLKLEQQDLRKTTIKQAHGPKHAAGSLKLPDDQQWLDHDKNDIHHGFSLDKRQT